ncbi:Uncharacterized protein SCG7086_AD_00090 [Chlamydiales bacterium SCGC AG-110-P3]|nr:Uncharacterized protein SCG7086_AD_00090 [Chlamydiales bacterium SCGC AG-110-P3]
MNGNSSPKGASKTSSGASQAKPAGSNGFGTFFTDVKSELGRITWTSKEELQVYTKIVVIATFVLGMAIYTSDLTIQSILNGLGVIFRFFGG